MLAGQLERNGVPNRIEIDEAHYYLHDEALVDLVYGALRDTTFVAYKVSDPAPAIQRAGEAIVVSRKTDPREARVLHRLCGTQVSEEHWRETPASLALDAAVLPPGAQEAGGDLPRLPLAPRLTRRVRHEHKYPAAPLAENLALHFDADARGLARTACSPREFADALECARPVSLDGHLRRGDFPRWIADEFYDGPLSTRLAKLKELHRLGRLTDVNGALVHAVRSRYRTTAERERAIGPR